MSRFDELMSGGNGTVTINDGTAKVGIFGGVYISTAGIVTAILDKDGNDVTAELITTVGADVDAGTWIAPHLKHGWFTSVDFDTARGTAVITKTF